MGCGSGLGDFGCRMRMRSEDVSWTGECVRRGEIKAVISEGGRSVFSTDERIETDGGKSNDTITGAARKTPTCRFRCHRTHRNCQIWGRRLGACKSSRRILSSRLCLLSFRRIRRRRRRSCCRRARLRSLRTRLCLHTRCIGLGSWYRRPGRCSRSAAGQVCGV